MGQPWVNWMHESPRRCAKTSAILELRAMVEATPGTVIHNVSPDGVTFTIDRYGRTEWCQLKAMPVHCEGPVAVVLGAQEPEVRQAKWLPAQTYNQLLQMGFMELSPLEPRVPRG